MFEFFRKGRDRQQAPAAKSAPPAQLLAWAQAAPVWSPRDPATLARTGFCANPVVYRAVSLIAESAAALPLVLQDRERRYADHPALALLERPNAQQGRAELFESLYGQLLLTGNAYVEAVIPASTAAETAAGDTGLPLALHVLRSDRMAVVPGADGWPAGWEYNVGGRKRRIPAGPGVAPLCHIRSFHPLDDHYGLSPMQAAAQAVDVHNSASRWSRALLDNAARPSGAFVWQGQDNYGQLTDEQYQRLRDEVETLHMGATNAGRPLLLEGGLDWRPMGFSPSDMEFHSTKEAAAREIATAFGVPPMLLGVPGDATYANYQEANRAFFRLAVLPLATRVAGALADWLADFSGESFDIRPDPDLIPALAAERDQHWKRVGEATFLSDAEKRLLLGLPARDVCDG